MELEHTKRLIALETKTRTERWVPYIEDELLFVCRSKGDWMFARLDETPDWHGRPPFGVPSESYLAWQLVPFGRDSKIARRIYGRIPQLIEAHRLQEPLSTMLEAAWYVLDFNHAYGVFRLCHSNVWSGAWKPSHARMTSTEISTSFDSGIKEDPQSIAGFPPDAWLSPHILALVEEFRPNSFSY